MAVKKLKPKTKTIDLREYNLENSIVGTQQIAELLGQGGLWLRSVFTRTGKLDTAGVGKLYLGPFLRALVEYYRGMGKLDKAERRTSVADIRAAKAARELVDARWAKDLFTANHTSLRAELEGIPALVTRDLELRKKITDGIHAAFKRHQAKIERELESDEDDS